MTTEDRNGVAALSYVMCIGIINEIASHVEEIKGEKLNIELVLKQFDCIIQGILLKTAFSDGEFHPLEKNFIREITDYADILEALKEQMHISSLSWDNIDSINNESRDILLGYMDIYLDGLASSFVEDLAYIDALSDTRNYYQELLDEIIYIFTYYLGIDNTKQEEKQKASMYLVSKLFCEKWLERKKEALEECVRKNEERLNKLCSKSLKGNYLKKNN